MCRCNVCAHKSNYLCICTNKIETNGANVAKKIVGVEKEREEKQKVKEGIEKLSILKFTRELMV